MAENLQMGQDALSSQPLTDRVRFNTSTLQIKAFSIPTDGMSSTTTIPTVTTTTLSHVTEASTMSSGTGSSNTTPGTTTLTSKAIATSSVSFSSTGFTSSVTSLSSVQTTLNGTGGTTSNENTVTTVFSNSVTTDATSVVTTVNGTVITTDSGTQNTSTSIGTQWTTPSSTVNHSKDNSYVFYSLQHEKAVPWQDVAFQHMCVVEDQEGWHVLIINASIVTLQ